MWEKPSFEMIEMSCEINAYAEVKKEDLGWGLNLSGGKGNSLRSELSQTN